MKMTDFSSKNYLMNFVNFMNLPRPLLICFVKKIKKGLFLRNITKQMGYPLPKFTKFIVFTGHFWPFFKKMMEKIVENTRFLLNSNVLSEFICICSGSKGVFCHGIRNDGVNFVKPAFFEVHREIRKVSKGRKVGKNV